MIDQTQTEQSNSEPRCADCGQPLVTWDQQHTTDDCQRWRDEDPHVREVIERNVREGRRS